MACEGLCLDILGLQINTQKYPRPIYVDASAACVVYYLYHMIISIKPTGSDRLFLRTLCKIVNQINCLFLQDDINESLDGLLVERTQLENRLTSLHKMMYV